MTTSNIGIRGIETRCEHVEDAQHQRRVVDGFEVLHSNVTKTIVHKTPHALWREYRSNIERSRPFCLRG